MDWLSVLSNNSEAVSAVATLLSAITTIGLAILYYFQHKELRRQREITSWSTAPRLTVLSIVVTSENEIEYMLKNQGERIAADIQPVLDCTNRKLASALIEL